MRLGAAARTWTTRQSFFLPDYLAIEAGKLPGFKELA